MNATGETSTIQRLPYALGSKLKAPISPTQQYQEEYEDDETTIGDLWKSRSLSDSMSCVSYGTHSTSTQVTESPSRSGSSRSQRVSMSDFLNEEIRSATQSGPQTQTQTQMETQQQQTLPNGPPLLSLGDEDHEDSESTADVGRISSFQPPPNSPVPRIRKKKSSHSSSPRNMEVPQPIKDKNGNSIDVSLSSVSLMSQYLNESVIDPDLDDHEDEFMDDASEQSTLIDDDEKHWNSILSLFSLHSSDTIHSHVTGETAIKSMHESCISASSHNVARRLMRSSVLLKMLGSSHHSADSSLNNSGLMNSSHHTQNDNSEIVTRYASATPMLFTSRNISQSSPTPRTPPVQVKSTSVEAREYGVTPNPIPSTKLKLLYSGGDRSDRSSAHSRSERRHSLNYEPVTPSRSPRRLSLNYQPTTPSRSQRRMSNESNSASCRSERRLSLSTESTATSSASMRSERRLSLSTESTSASSSMRSERRLSICNNRPEPTTPSRAGRRKLTMPPPKSPRVPSRRTVWKQKLETLEPVENRRPPPTPRKNVSPKSPLVAEPKPTTNSIVTRSPKAGTRDLHSATAQMSPSYTPPTTLTAKQGKRKKKSRPAIKSILKTSSSNKSPKKPRKLRFGSKKKNSTKPLVRIRYFHADDYLDHPMNKSLGHQLAYCDERKNGNEEETSVSEGSNDSSSCESDVDQTWLYLQKYVTRELWTECSTTLTKLYFAHMHYHGNGRDKEYDKNTKQQRRQQHDAVVEEALQQIRPLYELYTHECGKEEEDTLRGLEAQLCSQVVEGLRIRHIENVLDQIELDPSPEKLRRVSQQTSRPFREMAFHMAKHDTKEALASFLVKW